MKMKRAISVMLLLALALALVPGQVFASAWPQTYDIKFALQDGTVIESYEDVPYIYSVVAPDGYKEVTTWYCEALDMEVKNNERVYCSAFEEDREVVFLADSVLPESFTLNFKLPNGVKVGSVVLDPEDLYTFFTVPAVDGAELDWKAGNVELTGNQVITGHWMDVSYAWYESNPVLNFELDAEAVCPEYFTVRFINDNDEVVAEQTVDAWDFYTAIEIPEGNWMNYTHRVLVSQNDYISGQTLDLDFVWYSEHPVVDFYAN